MENQLLCDAFNRLAPRMLAVLRKKSPSYAEDHLQQTFLQAKNHWQQFDGVNLDAWLWTIARNVQIDASRVPKISTSDAIENAPAHEEEYDSNWSSVRHQFQKCLGVYTERIRRLIGMKIAKKPSREIAEILDMQPGTVDKTWHTTKKTLQECMGGVKS
jgi:RNA polymerase sigma factor (sigma-70 family)